MAGKLRVVVLYGGRSGEHEVSLRSGAAVIRHLDRERFEVIPISIDKAGRWQWNDLRRIEADGEAALRIQADAPEVRLAQVPDGRCTLVPISGERLEHEIDVVFPVMHGPLYEDGTVQGLLELAGVAYVGSGVLASAVGMDKDVAKRLASQVGIPIVPYRTLTRQAFERDPDGVIAAIRDGLTLPVFVKPCNMGSSVGVQKVRGWDALGRALAEAFQYDVKVLVEQGVDAREIEVAVLEADPLFVSIASELNPSSQHDFYSYEAKYLDPEGASVELPARLSETDMARVRDLAARAFEALECSGLARVDFFLDRQGSGFYFNEINTLPGFTSISMYPKMLEASGVPYPELLTRLVELALARHRTRHALRRDYAG